MYIETIPCSLPCCGAYNVMLVCIAIWSTLSFHRHPSMGLPVVHLAAHGLESRRWAEGVDPWTCQTFAASPAEPGELPCWFSAILPQRLQ